jgi:manganese transport protein
MASPMSDPDRTDAGAVTRPGDQRTLQAASDVLNGSSTKGFFRRLMPFLGPAFVASVAYIDPGNFATNIQGGAKYGYLLLWVIVSSNLIAMFVQSLSAKLGIATGKNLAEMCRANLHPCWTWSMWVIGEVVAMATDLAEFLGAALGFQLLIGTSLPQGALLTVVATLFILALEKYGFRPLEAVITVLLGVIAACYLIETFLIRPDWTAIAYGAAVPRFEGLSSVVLACGILGATVMPHVIFLHSALTQGRIIARGPEQMRRLFHYEVIDVVLAMGVAGLVNAAMLIMAASTFFSAGLSHIASIEEAHHTLEPLLGSASSTVFAISLLAAGLSSSAVGTMAGQIIMKGFVGFTIPVWLRRLITIAPTLVVIWIGFDPTQTLVMSQVVLSFGLPFAVVPLVVFTSRRDLMGVLVNRRLTTLMAWLVAVLIISLNIFLLHQTFWGG